MARINGVCDDNRLRNLRWSTPNENEDDKSYHGRTKRGQSLGCYLTTAEVIEIRTSLGTTDNLADRLGVCHRTIRNVRSRQNYAEVAPEVATIPKSTTALTPAQVARIKTRTATNVDLAREYGVGETTIRNIRSGRTWADVAPAVVEMAKAA